MLNAYRPAPSGFRRPVMTVLLAVAAMTLASCSSTDDPSSSSPSSADLSAITVSGGDKDTAPVVKIAHQPLSVSKTEVKALKPGKGKALAANDVASVDIALFNGSTGQKVNSSYESDPAALYLGQLDLLPGLKKGLTGQKVGSRILIAVPPADGFGADGNSALKVGPDDTMLFVIDVLSGSAMLTVATGTPVKPAAGMPTVKAGTDKAATITIPKGAKPPTTLTVKPLIKGKGAKVQAGQTLRVTYTGVLWRNGKKFDSSFGRQPGYFEFPVGGGRVIKAWDQGLLGQTVGSRLVLVVPPAYGYGAAGNPPDIKGTDTLVFVVDLLGAY
ncbi:MAG: FKBP-type peptidyl-prolyl cis-trans isomerase [Nostocoides sp.]